MEQVVVAYEPIWAISTFGGELAKPQQIKDAIDHIRLQVRELYGERIAKKMYVLYGGSVDEHLVRGYLEVPGCDGALVGGASLNYQKFTGIIDSAHRLQLDRA